MPTTAERVAIATRGTRYPARLADLLAWAMYNRADRQTLRELDTLPWRSYSGPVDVADQIGYTQQRLAAHQRHRDDHS